MLMHTIQFTQAKTLKEVDRISANDTQIKRSLHDCHGYLVTHTIENPQHTQSQAI